MDEQRLRVRIAALDFAMRMFEDPGEREVFQRAERLETWLTRDAAGHDAETTADRLGYRRCDVAWQDEINAGHACIYAWDHRAELTHKCSCGVGKT